MELLTPEKLENLINAELDKFDITRGLCINVQKARVVFDDGNNWMSYIEPKPEWQDRYEPSLEAKKMIQKLLGDMRLKYNLE
jgi:hypothetical protein